MPPAIEMGCFGENYGKLKSIVRIVMNIGTIRKLDLAEHSSDIEQFRDHLLRLDKTSRRTRFADSTNIHNNPHNAFDACSQCSIIASI